MSMEDPRWAGRSVPPASPRRQINAIREAGARSCVGPDWYLAAAAKKLGKATGVPIAELAVLADTWA